MCTVTAFHPIIIIDKLKNDIYPYAFELINTAALSGKHYTSVQSDAFLATQSISSVQLKDELESLFLYEQRLVFPSIILYNDRSDIALPDIYSIKKLIANKERKIRQYILDLKCVISKGVAQNDLYCLQSDQRQIFERLISFFENEFFPIRQLWSTLLDQLQEKQTHDKKNTCKNRINNVCCCRNNETTKAMK